MLWNKAPWDGVVKTIASNISLKFQYERQAAKAALAKGTSEVRAVSNPNSEKRLRGRGVSN